MNPKFWIIIFFCLFILGAITFDKYRFSSRSEMETPRKGDVLINTDSWKDVPEVVFNPTDGHPVRLSDFRGKVVILNFWATWCPTCRVEFGSLLKLVRYFKGDVVLIAVSADREKSAMDNFLSGLRSEFSLELDSNYVLVPWDPERRIIGDLFQTERFPEAIIVSKDGRMVRKVIGSIDWDGEKISGLVKDLLNL